MKLAIISFTQRGSRFNQMLHPLLSREGIDCCGYTMQKYAQAYDLNVIEPSLADLTARLFETADAILFIGAAGIAVRSIAPFLQHKTKDPAVVVMDEKGVFAISLLSGHLGGANELAGLLANLTGAIPVITTATDVNGRFAVDLFAKKNRLKIMNMDDAKQISADVLDEKTIGFFSDFPVLGEIPQELEAWDEKAVFEGSSGICVTLDEDRRPYKQTLVLVPQIVSIGVGCKKGSGFAAVEEKIKAVLRSAKVSIHSVERLASIDLKAQEPALRRFAQKYGIEFVTYTARELQEAPGVFEESAFVESVTGVSNVCERSAVLASGGRLLWKKTAGDGVTVALAVRDWSVEFG